MVCSVVGWVVGSMAGLRVVWLFCGRFVGGLAGLWVVLSFTANAAFNSPFSAT